MLLLPVQHYSQRSTDLVPATGPKKTATIKLLPVCTSNATPPVFPAALPVTLLTALSKSPVGKKVQNDLEEVRIDVCHLLIREATKRLEQYSGA